MNTLGRHLLVEYHGCDGQALNQLSAIERMMKAAARAAGATVVASVFHPFSPQGVSGVVVIEESHLSIHTWPESGYAAVDFYTCGNCDPELAHQLIVETLRPSHSDKVSVARGLDAAHSSMRIDNPSRHKHRTDHDVARRAMKHAALRAVG